jgi:hypothetical protein
LYVLDRFDVLMSKIIFKIWKNIIDMHFSMKSYLKSNRNHTAKYILRHKYMDSHNNYFFCLLKQFTIQSLNSFFNLFISHYVGGDLGLMILFVVLCSILHQKTVWKKQSFKDQKATMQWFFLLHKTCLLANFCQIYFWLLQFYNLIFWSKTLLFTF